MAGGARPVRGGRRGLAGRLTAVQGAAEQAHVHRRELVPGRRTAGPELFAGVVAPAHHPVVLEAGAIAEEGSHAELLARGGLYARFWSRQSGGFLDAGAPPPGPEAAA